MNSQSVSILCKSAIKAVFVNRHYGILNLVSVL
ncbi:Uncharacterized protein GNX_4375 [Leptospira interrogans serovar Canicola]|nr:Uncharacterized protein GNX_4375 [Leptospira interrogans serovar Canicola]